MIGMKGPLSNKLRVPELISDEMKAVLEQESKLAGDANDTSVGFEQMRENYLLGRAWWNEGGPVMVHSRDEMIPTRYGEVRVRWHYPVDSSDHKLPLIVFVHGGGFVLGGPESHDRITRILAQEAQAAVVSVDYTLSPDAKFPQAIVEVSDVIEHVINKSSSYQVDPDTLALSGDSGGAHICLGATLCLRDGIEGDDEQGMPAVAPRPDVHQRIAAELLFYGWFGLSDGVHYRVLGGPWDGLGEEDWAFYVGHYCKDVGYVTKHPLANQLAADLSHGIPPLFISACEFDPLRDDSAALAKTCEVHNIPHEHVVVPGVIHGYLHYTKMMSAPNDTLKAAARFYRNILDL